MKKLCLDEDLPSKKLIGLIPKALNSITKINKRLKSATFLVEKK